MNNLEKIKLIDTIGRSLQSQMTFQEIDSYFVNYGIPTNHVPSFNSKYVYVKEVLAQVKDETVLEIASELKIEHSLGNKVPIVKDEEATFWKPGHFRLFICHLASFQKTISSLKIELEKYGISSFVAHEDIEPTKEWQDEIEKGLFSMDVLCAVLMPGFSESKWTDQEIGVAFGRGILIIPIRRELDPYGFIGKFQGLQAHGKNIGQVAEGIFDIISTHTKSSTKLINCLTELFLLSNNIDEGQQRIFVIKKLKSLPIDKIVLLHDRIIDNKVLKNTKILKDFNELMDQYGLSRIQTIDFEVKKVEVDDGLPF